MRKLLLFLFAMLFLTGSSWAQYVIIGTATTNTNGSTTDPVERYYNYEHYQIMYTAAELAAQGMPAGATITAMGFNISESAVSLANYTIKMGLTAQTSCQPYISTLTTVVPAFTYTPVVGASGVFDMITLTTPFMWDGSSNLVINTCTGSNPFSSPYGGLYYTAATSGMITYVRTDGSDNCPTTSLTSTTYRPNIRFNYTAPVPCAGTPVPGNTVASNNPVCTGATFTLTLQNNTPGTGVTYQWQTSPDGSAWTNVGASVSSYTASQTVATYYRCKVTCSGNTGTSTQVYVTMNPLYNCYCSSNATYTGDEDIFNVTVGALNNTSTCTSVGPGPGSVMNEYSNYYGFVTIPDLTRTTSQSFSVQVGTCGGNYTNCTAIYIDYNQNGVFTDAGEQVYLSAAGTSGPHTESGTFTIPASAVIGNTMMRVICVETSTPSSITPCGTYGWGETEDYAVNLVDVCGVTTIAATSVTGTTATLNGNVSANGASTTVVFEYGTMSAPPFDHTVTLGSAVTGQNIAVNTNITTLQPNTPYYFRIKGTNSIGTTYGSILSFTTLAIPPAVTTQDATIIGATFATMNGTATAFNASTTVSFEYGTTTAYSGGNVAASPSSVTGNTPANFSAVLSGLVINTTYHYRAKGVNVAGTTYGLDKTFFTTCVVPPAPGAVTGPAAVCQNTTGYTYSITQVPYGFVYNWTFPAGFTITSYPYSNVVTVSVSGTAASGTASVYASSDCGANSPSSSIAITVNPLPVPTVTGPSPVCQSASYNYSSQSGQSGYVWTAGDGTITPTANPSIVSIKWPTAGAKTVGVIYTNPATGCTAAVQGTLPVTVNAAPVPTISGNSNLCVNSGYYDYTTETGKTGYIWTVTSGGTITGGQGTSLCEIQWNTPGAQTVTVNYNNASGCTAPAATVFNVSVNGIPGAPGAISGPSAVCTGSQGVSYSVPPITNAASYVWTMPAGVTIASGAGTNSITVNFSATAVTGDFTVYGNSTCGNGPVSGAYTVTVTPLPAAAGSVSGPDSVCSGSSMITYWVEPIANATGYAWALPAGAAIVGGDNTPTILVDFATGAISGDIMVHGTSTCGIGATSLAYHVVVIPKPSTPSITNHGDTLYSSIQDGNQWFYNGAPIVNANGKTFVAHYTGWYWDEIIINGCESDTSNNIYIVVSGVNEPVGGSFVVYPVPNDGQFKLQMNSPRAASFDISISNSIGVNIYTKHNVMVNGSADLMIDLRPVSAGIYTMVIRNGESKVVRKIIVNR